MCFNLKKQNKKAEGSNRFQNRLSRINTITIISMFSMMFFASCTSNQAEGEGVKRYGFTGRVESIDHANKKLVVAHNEIPEVMEAMTMPMAVNDESILNQYKSGDQIRATLVKDSSTNRMWLEDVQLK